MAQACAVNLVPVNSPLDQNNVANGFDLPGTRLEQVQVAGQSKDMLTLRELESQMQRKSQETSNHVISSPDGDQAASIFLNLSSGEVARRANVAIEKLRAELRQEKQKANKLAAQVLDLEKVRDEHRLHYMKLFQDNSHLRQAHDATQKKLQSLETQSQLDRNAAAKVRKCEIDLRERDAQIYKLRGNADRLEGRQASLTVELGYRDARITAMSEELQTQQKRHKQAESTLKLQEHNLTQKLQRTEAELKTAQQNFETKSQEMIAQRQKEEALIAQIQESKRQELACANDHHEVESLRGQLAAANDQLKRQVEQQRVESEARAAESYKYNQELYRLHELLRNNATVMNNQESWLRGLKQENSQQQSRLQSAEQESFKRGCDIDRLRIELQTERQNWSEAFESLTKAEETIRAQEAQISNISKQPVEADKILDIERRANEFLRNKLIKLEADLVTSVDHTKGLQEELTHLQRQGVDHVATIQALRSEIETLQSSSQHRIPASSNPEAEETFELPPFDPFGDSSNQQQSIVVETPLRPMADHDVIKHMTDAKHVGAQSSAQSFLDVEEGRSVENAQPDVEDKFANVESPRRGSDPKEQSARSTPSRSFENRLVQALGRSKASSACQIVRPANAEVSQEKDPSRRPSPEAAAVQTVLPNPDEQVPEVDAPEARVDISEPILPLPKRSVGPILKTQEGPIPIDRKKIKQSNRCTRCIELKKYCDGEPLCEECKVFYIAHEIPEQYCHYPFVARGLAMSKITPADYILDVLNEETDSELAALQLKRAAKFWRASTETDYPELKPTIINDAIRPFTAAIQAETEGPLRLTRQKRKSLANGALSRESTPLRKRSRVIRSPSAESVSGSDRSRTRTISPNLKTGSGPRSVPPTASVVSEAAVRPKQHLRGKGDASPVVQDSQEHEEDPPRPPSPASIISPEAAVTTTTINIERSSDQRQHQHHEDLESDSDDEIFAPNATTARIII